MHETIVQFKKELYDQTNIQICFFKSSLQLQITKRYDIISFNDIVTGISLQQLKQQPTLFKNIIKNYINTKLIKYIQQSKALQIQNMKVVNYIVNRGDAYCELQIQSKQYKKIIIKVFYSNTWNVKQILTKIQKQFEVQAIVCKTQIYFYKNEEQNSEQLKNEY